MRAASRTFFAAVLVALGVQGLVKGGFTVPWAPVPASASSREWLAHLCALVTFGAGVGLLWRRSSTIAARLLVVALSAWVVIFRVPPITRAPLTILPWDGCAETVAIVSAAWVLATSAKRARVGRVLYGLTMIPFGLAHLAYVKETATLVPRWVPAHVAVAYLTGFAFLAAGAGILTGVRARLAAWLSAVQVGLFTGLVWVPIVAFGTADAFSWSELAISTAITAAGWVVADSYR
jgi:hypothetical protein